MKTAARPHPEDLWGGLHLQEAFPLNAALGMKGPLWRARLPAMLFPQPPPGGAPEHCAQVSSPGDSEPG